MSIFYFIFYNKKFILKDILGVFSTRLTIMKAFGFIVDRLNDYLLTNRLLGGLVSPVCINAWNAWNGGDLGFLTNI